MMPLTPQANKPTPPVEVRVESVPLMFAAPQTSDSVLPLTVNVMVPVLPPALADLSTVNELLFAWKSTISAWPLLVKMAA